MKCMKFLASHIIKTIVLFLLMTFFLPLLYDKLGWLQAEWRVLEDGFRSGYMRGTPFKTSQGYWAIEWRLGGQPIIHIIIPHVFMLISLFGGLSCLIYLTRKYYSFRLLKGVVTYLRRPKNFRSSISVSIVAVTLLIFLAGLIGTTIDPNIIIPAEPSKGYLEVNLKISASCYVEITRFVIVETDTDILDRNNMTGWFYCIIKTPENAFWNISDIDVSSILLNGELHPSNTLLHVGSNDTISLLVTFDKESLMFLFENYDSSRSNILTLSINGTLKNGDFFAGSSQVKIA